MLEEIIRMLDALTPDPVDRRQNQRLQALTDRLNYLKFGRTEDAERNVATAIVRLLLKKGIISADELADELSAVEAEQFARIGRLDGAAPPVAPSEVRIDTVDDDSPVTGSDRTGVVPATEVKIDVD